MTDLTTVRSTDIKNIRTKYSILTDDDLGEVNWYSSLQGSVEISPRTLKALFGKPLEADSYKVSGEYVIRRNSDDKLFFLYDWKSTSLYCSDGPSPDEFWDSERVYNFHIGSSSQDGVSELIADLLNVTIHRYEDSIDDMVHNVVDAIDHYLLDEK